MLGLGDIVIPGIFVALLLRYDTHNGGATSYFYRCRPFTAGFRFRLAVLCCSSPQPDCEADLVSQLATVGSSAFEGTHQSIF